VTTIRGERIILGLILTAIFVALSFHADQPIVENYVGRQIPTAMVARNLDRGSGFGWPSLDTAPFPNHFWVEPPIYAQLVAWVKAGIEFVPSRGLFGPTGFVWEISGRLTSAVLLTLGAWSLHGLVRRREGSAVALVALASFGVLPVTLRYGRAFQPDTAMVGFVLCGLRCWDEYEVEGRWRWAGLGGLAMAVGLAIKITSAWVLIPFLLVATRLPVAVRALVGLLMLLPAIVWYRSVWGELGTSGSQASVDNAAIWFATLAPTGWLRFATWEVVGRNLLVRAFTPVGFVLAVLGWTSRRPRLITDRLWLGWGVGCGLAIVALGAKWHHGYYWLVVGPLVAVGVARTLVLIAVQGRRGRLAAVGLGSLFLLLCGYQSASTWQSPPGWVSLRESAAEIAARVPRDSLLIAPEAVLYYADRSGYRLEFSPAAARRASGEFGRPLAIDQVAADPMALVDFYATEPDQHRPANRIGPPTPIYGTSFRADFVADIGSVVDDERRIAWRDALRRRPGTRILLDRPTLILAEIGTPPDFQSSRPQNPLPQP